MKLIIFILGLILSLPSFGQTRYFEFKFQADSLLEIKNYSKSAEFYTKAFKEKEGTKLDYFNATCSYAMSSKDIEKAFQYLQQSIDKGMYDLSLYDTEEKLKSLKEHSKWNLIRQNLITEKRKFENGLNIPLKEKLEQVYVRDQTIRKVYQLARKESEIDSLGMEYIVNLMNKEDSLCQKEIIKILDTHGWLGINQVGELANKAIWLVIQHSPLEIQEQYYPLMEASVKIGQSNGSDFAYLVDRVLMRKGEKQLYGSQYKFNRKTKKRYFYPIEDYKNVNKRREDVGLMPIEKYAELIRLKYDPSEWKE